jgi:thiopeptide-type bacteriocin biosynthesis protein
MATRSTPFGLFAGCTMGSVGDHNRLRIGGIETTTRHTRLDMDFLSRLVQAAANDACTRRALRWHPNPTIYEAAGRVRFVQVREAPAGRTHHLAGVLPTPTLRAVLGAADRGASLDALVEVLRQRGVGDDDAERYIGQLFDSQILVADLQLPVTGPEPLRLVVEQFRTASMESVAEQLQQVGSALRDIDDRGVGVDPDRYHEVAAMLEGLPARAQLARLFQVDIARSALDVTIDRNVVETILLGIKVLHRIHRRTAETALEQFRRRFVDRYGTEAVPLAEALDSEVGISFTTTGDPGPLVRDIPMPPQSDARRAWGPRDEILLTKLLEAARYDAAEIVLAERDIDAMAAGPGEDEPLPAALAAFATLVAESPAQLHEGRFVVLLHRVAGPSGARLLGRFCHGDPGLLAQVSEHLADEELLDPDAVHAEVTHLPEGRVGNILHRPVLRTHEITYLGASGAPIDRQLSSDDLLVAVRGDRVVLWSRRLGRRVEPRLTTAHNFDQGGLPLYRFLCAMQTQGVVDGLAWDWGALESAPYLPRVRLGPIVLSRARWQVSTAELRHFDRHHGADLYTEVQKWRAARRLPRLAQLSDADSLLLIDLDSISSIESFVQLTRARTDVVLVELYPSPDELCVDGPEGLYAHELVVPFVARQRQPAPRRPAPIRLGSVGQRRLAPGSVCAYLKVYCGEVTADTVLTEVVAPLRDRLIAPGVAEHWFFVRYADPDSHLRIRFFGSPERLHELVLPELLDAMEPVVRDGLAWRLSLDTYEREVERYGGAQGVLIAERIFHADSDAVVDILSGLGPGEGGARARWQLALRGADVVLAALGLPAPRKLTLMRELERNFADEHRFDGAARRAVARRYRQEYPALEALLDPTWAPADPLAPACGTLARLGECIAAEAVELNELDRLGLLGVTVDDAAASFVHMHVNRLLRSNHRLHEAVLYAFLARLYEGRVRRAEAP